MSTWLSVLETPVTDGELITAERTIDEAVGFRVGKNINGELVLQFVDFNDRVLAAIVMCSLCAARIGGSLVSGAVPELMQGRLH